MQHGVVLTKVRRSIGSITKVRRSIGSMAVHDAQGTLSECYLAAKE
jgi:hypothetical protein